MCDPLTIAGLVDLGVNIIQGNIDRDTANKQATAELQGIRNARNDLTTSTQKGVDALNPYAQGGVTAQSRLLDIARRFNDPLEADATFNRELQLANQQASARGVSTSPSFQAELYAAAIPGVAQRRGNLLTQQAGILSPIFATGVGAATNIASMQNTLGANLAGLNNTGLIESARLGAVRPNIGRTAGFATNLASNFFNRPKTSNYSLATTAPNVGLKIFN